MIILQDRIRAFCIKHALSDSLEHRLLDAMSEMGEVAKDVLTATDYGRRSAVDVSSALSEELGDLLFSIITVANSAGVNLEEAIERTLEKYEKRMRDSGSIGSDSSMIA